MGQILNSELNAPIRYSRFKKGRRDFRDVYDFMPFLKNCLWYLLPCCGKRE